MKRIVMLNCLRANSVCTGAACLQAFNAKTKTFARYGDEPLELVAFFRCNGCDVPQDDAGMEEKIERCALPGFVDSKNEEKTERNAGYLVVSHSGGGMLRQGTRKGIRRTPANRGMRAHWVVKGLDISEDVCHGMCP